MPEKISFLKEEAIIKVESSGAVSLQDLKDTRKELLGIGKQEDCRNVLIDARRQESVPDLFEIYRFGTELPGNLRIALLTGTHPSPEQSLLTIVGENRGKHIRLFNAYDKATNWLNEFAVQNDRGDA